MIQLTSACEQCLALRRRRYDPRIGCASCEDELLHFDRVRYCDIVWHALLLRFVAGGRGPQPAYAYERQTQLFPTDPVSTP